MHADTHILMYVLYIHMQMHTPTDTQAHTNIYTHVCARIHTHK